MSIKINYFFNFGGSVMQNLLLSARIKERCKHNKIAIKALLLECSMNRNTIYDLENKSSFPSSDKLSRIADYLDCSVDYLLGRTDNPNAHKTPTEIKLKATSVKTKELHAAYEFDDNPVIKKKGKVITSE